jgi:hypothetical protein
LTHATLRLILVGALLAAGGSALRAEPPAPAAIATDAEVEIAVFFDAELHYAASVAYRHRVDEGQARADLQVLCDALGYKDLTELQPTDAVGKAMPLQYATHGEGAQMGFRLSETAVDREQGRFPLEAYVKAYRAYRRIDLTISVADLAGRRFVYRGPTQFDGPKLRMRFRGEPQSPSYEFRFDVLDASADSFDLPSAPLPAVPIDSEEESPDRKKSPVVQWVVMVLAATGGAALTYGGLVRLLTRRGGRRRTRRKS